MRLRIYLVLLVIALIGAYVVAPRAQFDAVPTVVRPLPHWSLVNDPAVNTAATATRAASSTGGVHVADCVSATFIAGTTAPAAVNVTVVIRDGTTGAGTVLFAADLALAGTISDRATPVQLCGLSIPGSANTAMTVEFTAAGGANTFETVALTGYDRAP
jgi:hypothetical protein